MIWVLLLVLVCIVGFGCYGARKRQFVRKPKLVVNDHVTFPIEDFRGSSISVCENACAAVKKLDGKRFLLRETPSLPVVGCDVAACECSYVQLEDRRSGEDNRRIKFSAGSGGSNDESRKGQPDRRRRRSNNDQ